MTFRRNVAIVGAILLAAGYAAAQSGSKKADSPDLKEIRDYRLNMDVIQRYMHAIKAITEDPAVKKCSDNISPGNSSTLDDGEKKLKTCAAAVGVLTANGIKPREFMIVTAALMGDFMAVAMKKSGTIKEYPPSISPENAAFIEQNYDKLQALMAPMSGKK